MPRVSVIIPTYDRAEVLARAVDSVLAQTLTDLELIVVDDASTDHTPLVMDDYDDPRIRYIRHEENAGGSAARNTGIEVATGEYIALLDSDDAWRPRKLEVQLEAIEARSTDWVGAYCNTTFVSPDRLQAAIIGFRRFYSTVFGQTRQTEGGEELIKHVLADELHTSAGSTLVVERDVVESIDGFDESFERFQDAEFLIRVLREGKIVHVEETLVERYVSDNPPAEKIHEADVHYLDTFSDELEHLETRGYDIQSAHEFMLARLYFSEGRFSAGTRHLGAARWPKLAKVPSLVFSVVAGLHARITSPG